MIDLDAMERDPWKTWPVQKDDIRNLGAALQEMETANVMQHQRIIACHQALVDIINMDPSLIGSAQKMWEIAFGAMKTQ